MAWLKNKPKPGQKSGANLNKQAMTNTQNKEGSSIRTNGRESKIKRKTRTFQLSMIFQPFN